MLKKRLRLRASEVRETLARGIFRRSIHLQMRLQTTPEALRAAVVVPKSLVRKAVKRNSLRRAAYRALSDPSLPKRTGRAVFFIKVVPKDAPSTVFREDFMTLLSKI